MFLGHILFNKKPFVIILCVILIMFYKLPIPKTSRKNTKFILYWSPYPKERWDYYNYGYEAFEGCEYDNCYATKDRTLIPLENFDAIVFHASYSRARHGVPSTRSSRQIYIFMNLEPPTFTRWNLKPYKSYYNWTMTYRLDSDIVNFYAYYSKESTKYNIPSREVLINKSGAVWFANHCTADSKREFVVEELQKLYKVDVFGNNGRWHCPYGRQQTISSTKVFEIIEKKYKFYLLFDDCYCKDYISRNLYAALLRNVIPVVYSGGFENAALPPESVINIEDFQTLKHLATYLHLLDENVDHYAKYFQWKKDFVIAYQHNILISKSSFCQLCKKLNEPIEESIYLDLYNWWWGKENLICKTGKDLPNIVTDLLYPKLRNKDI